MKINEIDLYEYFGVKKPENGVGILYSYIIDNSREIDTARKHPAMVVIPGGGYSMTSDREAEPVALAYTANNFNSFVLRYSCSPVRHPYQLAEAIMAMNYIRLNADKLSIDPNMVAAVGFSAGGHLCAMLGSIPDDDGAAEIFKSKVNARPNAIVLGYPVITSGKKAHQWSFMELCGKENEELIKKLDITNLVDKNSAPAFIWSTNTDNAVPCRNALLAALAYDEAEVPFSLHVWGKGEHGLSLANACVYGSEAYKRAINGMTQSVKEWVDLSIEWLAENGVRVKI